MSFWTLDEVRDYLVELTSGLDEMPAQLYITTNMKMALEFGMAKYYPYEVYKHWTNNMVFRNIPLEVIDEPTKE